MNEKQTKEFFMKVKWRNFKEKMKDRFHRFVNRCRDLIANRPEVFTAILGVFATILGGMFKMFSGRKRLKANEEEKRLKECYYYDRRRGHYVETRRKLKSSELLELDKRYKNGEDYTTILNSMRLTK